MATTQQITHRAPDFNSSESSQLATPCIRKHSIQINNETWEFRIDPIHNGLVFLPNGELHPEFETQATAILGAAKQTAFVYPITVTAVPLLLQVNGANHEAGIYTARGNSELFFSTQIEDVDYIHHAERLKVSQGADVPTDIDLVTSAHRLPNFDADQFQEVYRKTLENEKEVEQLIDQYRPSLMERISDFSLNLTAQYVLVRNHLLKFLAILPSLDHDRKGSEVKRIFLEAIRRLHEDNHKLKKQIQPQERPLPSIYILPLRLIKPVIELAPARLVAWGIRSSVRFMAKRFIAGETIQQATGPLKSLRSSGREATLDQLGELVVSEKEADHYQDKVLELIRGFSNYVPKGEKNAAGIHSAHVSIKVSALASHFVPEAFDYTYAVVAPRLRTILLAAKEADVFINIDAEHYPYRDLVFKIYKKLLLETPELNDFDATGIVVQAYLRDACSHLDEITELAKTRSISMPVRLVKGAYWDAETVEADAHSFKAPQFLNKEETDIHFRQLVYRIFEAGDHLKLCLASHNLFDHAFARALREELFPNLPIFEHQCLHMTYEGLSTGLAKWGVPVRNYVPVGSLLVGMAYLVRRIMENSSQVGFLSKMRNSDTEKVFTPSQLFQQKRENQSLTPDLSRLPSPHFVNTAPVRLYLDQEKVAFDETLAEFKTQLLGKEYPNRFKMSGDWQTLTSPSDPNLQVGRIRFATIADAESAISTAQNPSNRAEWSRRTAGERGQPLIRAAQIMMVRRLELASLIVFEAGKSLHEAVADVDEAVDFLNLYAREEIALTQGMPTVFPRGLLAVISPWNFPLAIPCGMASAALVAGNSVILKSAEQTPLTSQVLVNILHDAGIPPEVLIHLPGDGESVGAKLVEDPRVDGVIFTGSKAVGTWIAKTAGQRIRNGSPSKVVTEMGGKNAIIVTSSAELDETVAGVLYSAFAHAGQKCSALSRVLVDASIKERFIERFAEAARDLHVGEAWSASSFMNPVISDEDQNRLRQAALNASEEATQSRGKVHVDRSQENLPGRCVGPVVIELPKTSMFDENSSSRKEHFGPIVHVLPYESLEEAVEMFNSVDYGLTGGIFSQSEDDIDYLMRRLEAGNLYVNRSCTGARVGIEPFGGFKLSGTGPKAGHEDYLKAFHQIDRDAELMQSGFLSNPRKKIKHPALKRIVRLRDQELHHILAQVEKSEHFDIRTHWKEFLAWSHENLASWLAFGEPNHKIPGQVSRNDFGMSRPSTTLIVTRESLDYGTWLNLTTGLILGVKTRVYIPDESLRPGWEEIIRTLQGLEFSIELIPLESNDQSWTASTYLVDGNEKLVEAWLQRIYTHPDFSSAKVPWVPTVMTSLDGPHLRDYPSIYKQQILIRSFAINTMRHGAPLELDLNTV